MTVTEQTAWTHTFTHNRQPVTVTMIEPELARDGSMTVIASGVLYLVEKLRTKITQPTWGIGVIAEATYLVKGLDSEVRFSTGYTFDARYSDRHKNPSNMKEIIITSMTVTNQSSITSETLSRIPAGKLLAAAMRAGGVRVVYYPDGYNGPSLAQAGWTTIVTGDQDNWEVAGHIDREIRAGFVEQLTGQTDVPNNDTRLERVAEIVNMSRANRQTFDVATAMNVGERQARRLIQQARESGYLPPLDPDDKRTRKAQK